MQNTDWEKVGKWYNQIVGNEGHYYHRQVILPKILKLFDFQSYASPSLLDLACGQGVLAGHIPENVSYTGIDLSSSLIQAAKKNRKSNQSFHVGDICKSLPIEKANFTHASIVLALQNLAHPEAALLQAATHMVTGGVLLIVLNHPCFRIPRQSSWGVDEKQKLQYRRVDRYLTHLKIPIQMHPGKGKSSETTWTFHYSLSDYSRFLANAGFTMLLLEEWTSDKKSFGKTAKMENLARSEFPLFLTILAQKIL